MSKSTAILSLSSVLIVILASLSTAVCPDGDLNDDCIIDWQDVEIFTSQWLDPYPSREGLAAYWMLDGDAKDAAGGNDGTIYGALDGPTLTAGQIDEALNFHGVDDYIDCGNDSRP